MPGFQRAESSEQVMLMAPLGSKAAQFAMWGFREKLSDRWVNQWETLMKEYVGYYSPDKYFLYIPAEVTLNLKQHW